MLFDISKYYDSFLYLLFSIIINNNNNYVRCSPTNQQCERAGHDTATASDDAPEPTVLVRSV